MTKDPNYIVKLEKAIKEKYGELATKNPRSLWSEDKEKEYLQQLKEKVKKEAKTEIQEAEGYSINNRLFKKEQNRTCPVCDEFSFSIKDDLYMSKFDCCFPCYVQWVEDREERWNNGWRPDVKRKT